MARNTSSITATVPHFPFLRSSVSLVRVYRDGGLSDVLWVNGNFSMAVSHCVSVVYRSESVKCRGGERIIRRTVKRNDVGTAAHRVTWIRETAITFDGCLLLRILRDRLSNGHRTDTRSPACKPCCSCRVAPYFFSNESNLNFANKP